MTPSGAPVVVVLGTDPGKSVDVTTTRQLAAALATAARTAGAQIVNAVPGAVGAAIDAIDGDGSPIIRVADDLVAQVTALAGAQRVTVVLLAGDATTARVLLDDRAHDWSVVAMPKTGGLAAQLAGTARHRPVVVRGDDLVQLRQRHIAGVDVERVGHTVVWNLDDADVVKQILARRKSYDNTARVLQSRAHVVELGVLTLGVVAVFLSVFDSQIDASDTIHEVFRWVLIVVPAVVAALIALDGVLASGKRWLLIRATCEAIKREIFVWRTRTGVYAPGAVSSNPDQPGDATELLANRVAVIEADLMGSIVAATTHFERAGESSYVGATKDDDGLSQLDASGYVRLRLADQLAYYRRKIARLNPQRRTYQVVGICAGVTGSILSTAGETAWVAVAFAIGAAMGAYARQRQLDTTLLGFSRASAALEEIRTRWDAAPPQRHTDVRFEQLVHDVEHALEAEQSNWAKQMKVALDTPLPLYEDLSKSTREQAFPAATEVDAPSESASPTDRTAAAATSENA